MHVDPISVAFGTTGPVDRATFHRLLEAAVSVARPGSAPVLVVIELEGLRQVGLEQGPEAQGALARAAAGRLAATVGTDGFVSWIREGRIAILVSSDGPRGSDALGAALLATLARPVEVDGAVLPPGATLASADWGTDGETADELFVMADQRIHAARKEGRADSMVIPATQDRIRFVASPLRISA